MNSTAIVLVARSAITDAPLQEMDRLTAILTSRPGAGHVTFAFTEQGEPSLHVVLQDLRAFGYTTVVLVPLVLPMEPNFVAFLVRSIHRWQSESPGPWPAIRIGQRSLGDAESMAAALAEITDLACASPPVEPSVAAPSAGSIVPAQKRRVLVCLGAPCQSAGASLVWGHLRNEQKRLNLRTEGEGMASVKTTCLGPCSLAPVLQVYPEGVFYGGVDERGIDRIIEQHLRHGDIVEDLAYEPTGAPQCLRSSRGDV